MQISAIDIHHHYVPELVVGEAKQHGKALGIKVFDDNDGTIRISFNGGPRYPLLQGLTDVERRLQMMQKGRISMAALDPSTQLLGYDLLGEQAESWCRLYNECVKEFLETHPDRFTAMAAVPIQEPDAPPEFWSMRSSSSIFAAPIFRVTLTTVTTTAKISILSGPKRRI